jgi:hypothetical protein
MSVLYSDTLKIVIGIHKSIEEREGIRVFRVSALKSLPSYALVKQAFDTRRIDQNTQYNPRRNLQYYHRSDPFINDQDILKINALQLLKETVDNIKDEFIGEPEWFDSYASDLDHSLEKIFAIADGKNFDFSSTAIQYLEQLLNSRYRLSLSDIVKNSSDNIRKIIIHKDEKLKNSGIYNFKYLSKKNKLQSQQQIIAQKKEKQIKSSKIITSISDIIDTMCDDENKLEKLKLEEELLINTINNKKISLDIIKQDKISYQKIIAEKKAKENVASYKLWSYYNSSKKIEAEKQKTENIILSKIKDITNINNKIIKDELILNNLIVENNKFTQILKQGKEVDITKKINHNTSQQEVLKKKIALYRDDIFNIERAKQEMELLRNKKMYDIKQYNDKMIIDRPSYDIPYSERILAEGMLKEKIIEEKNALKELAELNINTMIRVDKIIQERMIIKSRSKENLEQINELRSLNKTG